MVDHATRPNKEHFVGLILDSLSRRKVELADAFQGSLHGIGVRYVAIDDLLPAEIATAISEAFPLGENMRLMKTFREQKYTSKSYDKFAPILGDVTFAFQDPKVVSLVEEITGIQDQVPDSLLYAGGLSAMTKGHFLRPHIDNSHDSSRSYYRTLNLLYYVTPGWTDDNGGNLQLWDRNVSSCVTIASRFNRLVLMETTPWSWHSVNTVVADATRKCVSNYYFSRRSPTGKEYFNVTTFSAPPQQPLLRCFSLIDNNIRAALRLVKSDGLGRRDIYEGPPR